MNQNKPYIHTAAVIMSTYNGERYLKKQLDSILEQAEVSVEIYIRDDGSTDFTKRILAQYETVNKNIHVEYEKNVGVGNSFMSCLYSIKDNFDYFAFCDQDDIWLPSKLIEAINFLKKHNKQLYFSNQTCVDKKGNVIGERYDLTPKYGVLDCLSNNLASGCTFVFTQKFKELLVTHKPSEKLLRSRIHDVWVAEVAALENQSIYDHRSFILYRQHGSNVVGAYIDNSFLNRLCRKVKKLRNSVQRNGRSKLAKEIYNCFPEYQTNKIIKYLALSNTLKGKIDLINNYNLFSEYDSKLKFFVYIVFNLL